MDKIIYFGISESSSIRRLVTSYNMPDKENKEGHFLGIIKISGKHYLITLSLKGNHITVNEVLPDSYMDGDISFYYNTSKSRNCLMLEDELNNPTVLHLIQDEGQDIKTILKRVTDVKPSSLQKAFDREFQQSKKTMYPDGLDGKKILEGNGDEEIKQVDVLTTTVLGISNEVFENLRMTLDKYDSSFYSLARRYDDLQREIERLYQENDHLKRELANNHTYK